MGFSLKKAGTAVKASSPKGLSIRLLGSVLSVVLVMAGLGSPGAANADEPSAGEKVEADLMSAAWFELPPKNRTGVVPRSALDVAPGGTAIWGAEITAGTDRIGDDNPVFLRFNGFPQGFEFGAAAGVPQHVKDDDKAVIENCTPSGGGAVCRVSGQLAPGELAIVGVGIRAVSAPVGVHQGTVEVFEGDGTTGATTPLTVEVRSGIRDALFVTTGAPETAPVGAPKFRELQVFNLGGSQSQARRATVKLKNVVPARLARQASASGTGWKCRKGGRGGVGTCTWKSKSLPVGGRTEPLHVMYMPAKSARRGIRAVGGAHTFNWVMGVKGSSTTQPSKHLETVHLLAESPGKPAPTPAKTPEGNLIVTASVLGTPVIGGRGHYRVAISNGGRRKVSGAKLKIKVPSHAKIKKFSSAPGWRCNKKTGTCTRGKKVAAKQGLPPILFTTISDASRARAGNRRKQTVVQSSWAGKGSDRMRKHRVVVAEEWAPALDVQLTTTTPNVHSGEHNTIGTLHANIANLNDRPMIYRWHQICKKRCGGTAVSWKNTPAGSTKNPVLSQSFTPPRVNKPTKLKFELRVSSMGAKIKKRVGVKVMPLNARHDPRLERSQWSGASAKNLPPALDRNVVHRAKAKSLSSVRISAKGPTVARPGKRVTLRAVIKPRNKKRAAQVTSIKWRFDRNAAVKLKNPKVRNGGRTFTFTAPKSGVSSHVVSVVVGHRKGASTTMSEVIHVRPKRVKKRVAVGIPPVASRSLESPDQQMTSQPTDRAGSPQDFCALFALASDAALTTIRIDSVELATGTVTTTGSSCTAAGAAINLTGAQLTVGGVGLTNLSGTINSTGLTINSGTVKLPTDDPSIPANLTTINFSSNGDPLVVAFADGVLSGMSGTIPLTSLPLLSLPVGWNVARSSATPSQITMVATSGGFYAAQISAYVTGPAEGAASVIGTINADGSYALGVTAANMMPLSSASDGSTAVFSGAGTITHAVGTPVVYKVVANMVTKNAVFPLYGGFGITSAGLQWQNSGLTFNGIGQASLGGATQNITLTGKMTDLFNWTINVATDYTINFANGSISDLGGDITMTRANPQATPQLAIGATADVTIDAVRLAALKVTTTQPPTAHYGIYCNNVEQQQQTAATACKNKTMQLQLDIVGTIDLSEFGDSATIPLNVTVNADPATMDFNLRAAVTGGTGFGPDILNASGLEFFATDNPTMAPQLAGNACMTDATMASQQMVYGATGQYDMGDGFTGILTVVYNSSAQDEQGHAGVCITATVGSAQTNGLLPDGFGSFSRAGTLIYSSWTTTLNINNVPTNIVAAQLSIVVDGFGLPQGVTSTFGADPSFQAIITVGGTLSSFSVTGNYAMSASEGFIIGNESSDSTSLKVQTIGLSISKVQVGGTPQAPVTGFSFGLDIQLMLNTEGASGVPVGATTATVQDAVAPSGEIPMEGSLGFALKPAGGFVISLGVQIGSQNGQMIDNFLGLSGLNVQDLKIMAQFGGNDFIGVGASVQIGPAGTTLGDLGSYVGLQPNTDISFAFQISEVSPCFAISIGNPDTSLDQRAALRLKIADVQAKIKAETAGANNLAVLNQLNAQLATYNTQLASFEAGKVAATAIDWFGIVEAQYVMMYFAPNGCPVATTSTLPSGTSGYAFDFEGSVFGTAVDISGDYSTGFLGSSGSLDVSVAQGGWSLAGLTAQPLTCSGPGTVSDGTPNAACTEANQVLPLFNLNFTNKKYETAFGLVFGGTINVWGAIQIKASGDINVTIGAQGISTHIQVAGSESEDLLGIFKEDEGFTFNTDWQVPTDAEPYFSDLEISATATTQVLVFRGTATFGFDYGPIVIDGSSQTVVTDMNGSFSVTVDLWIAEATLTASFAYTRPFTCTGGGAPTGLPAQCPAGEPAFCNDGAGDACYTGSLAFNVSGSFSYWFFGEHTDSINLIATTIPIHFTKAAYSPPPPMVYQPLAPPVSQWPKPTWGFTTNMFRNVPWDSTELANAASGGLPGQSPTGSVRVGPGALGEVPCPTDATKKCAPQAGTQTNSANFVPQPTYPPTGGVTLGQTTAPADSYAAITGTMPQLATPTYHRVVQNFQADYKDRPLPSNLTNNSCSGTVSSGNFSTHSPQWDNAPPSPQSKISFAVADLNWKLYLATVVEEASIAGSEGSTALKAAENYKCGYANWANFPSLNDWLDKNSAGPMFNVAYPQSIADTTHEQQLCQAPESYPSGDFESNCSTNLGYLNSDSTTPWGSGWGG